MSLISTPAIMLRRVNYGDYDLICTFFSLDKGKIPLIAKSAKKSKKRFAGVLEPYCVLDIVYKGGTKRGLPVLREASVSQSFPTIRTSITKTAYAAFMAELINAHMEEQAARTSVFNLYRYALETLDKETMQEEAASIFFQMRFMALCGFRPILTHCLSCGHRTDELSRPQVTFDLKKGGVLCMDCSTTAANPLRLSIGTIKQLLWLEQDRIGTATRIRFSPAALAESLKFLEAFVPFYLGKELKSLKFLQQLRR
jgi:DNA repair protein RecO (recombination protein O)